MQAEKPGGLAGRRADAPAGWENVRRILAVRLDNIGDVVMLGPALRAVAAALPEASITLLATPAGSQVAPLLPWVDGVMTVRPVWQDLRGDLPFDPDRELALTRGLRDCHFDAAFIFTSFSQSPYPPAYACYLAGIPVRIGQSREFGGQALSTCVKPLPDETHQADRNLHLVEAAGFPVASRDLELRMPEEVQAAADRLLADVGIRAGEPFVALAPGASAAARRYDPLRYAAAARGLSEAGCPPVVALGSEREGELARPIVESGADVRSLIGRTSVGELAAVIRRAALLVANDSGPMHFADAFRVPMVILYAGTEYESQWAPRSAANRLLRRPTDCSPCYAFQCPFHMECLDISAEEVVAEAVKMLRGVR